ncbi:hypothetical protein EXA18_00645 [Vibrio cincinnatiensis]|uniref:tape measure protein n=1 Tax=Vibrio cincinnatiensis TaxID=675 RepID=UPI001EDE1219|nr:tape measure protein [Vibrio cincinnatiensis]MCG3741991.1 hypothetical protein [Vibrio cincinnatiensis]
MERVRSQYTNLVKLRLDHNSLKRTRKQLLNFKRDINKELELKTGINIKMPKQPRLQQPTGLNGFALNQLGLKPKATLNDNHVKAFEQQQKFVALQSESIEKFMISNRLIRQGSDEQKKAIRQQLMQTTNAKSLRLEQLRIRTSLQDEHQKRKQMVNTMRQQQSVQKSIASTVALTAAGFATISAIRTGASMEGIEKSFAVVSKNSADAADNLAWVRKESMRLGTPLMESSKGYAGLIAAAGDKMSRDELRTTFTGVTEASAALGLSADETSGILLALKQTLSKGRIQAEELTGQLGERLPFAMRAMSDAAVKAGLIDGSKTAQEREAALFKLMEQGKLISSDILPHFGKQLSILANNGGELTKYLEKGLNPQLGRAKSNFTELQNQFSKGMSPATVNLLDGFNDLSDELKVVANYGGKIVGAAMITLGTAIRVPIAAASDLAHWLDTTFNLSSETKSMIADIGIVVGGGVLAFGALRTAIGAVTGSILVLKKAKSGLTFNNMGGMCGDGIDIDSKGKRKGGRVGKRGRTSLGKAVGKGAIRTGGNAIKNAAMVSSPYAAAAATSYMGGGMINDSLGNFDWYRNADQKFTGWLRSVTGLNIGQDNYWANKGYPSTKSEVDVTVKVDAGELNSVFSAQVDQRIDKAQGNLLENAYMNMQSGGVR